MRPWQAVIKRTADVIVSAIALVILVPVGIVIALAVVLDSSGPAIYGARRVGRHGQEFTMWKFRSMARGADAVGPGITGAYDARVTRVGSYLRRTKLDELPQLFNVLAGQMSLVGPRPEAPEYVARWRPEEREVLKVRPGITGPTQVTYIDEEELLVGDVDDTYEREVMHAKLAMDLDYVRRYGLGRDFAIAIQTLASIFRPSGGGSARRRRRYTLGERLRSASPRSLMVDALLAAAMAALAVGLRIDRNNIAAAVAEYWVFVPLAAFVRPAGFVIAGAYLRVWRYPTVSDVALVISSLAAGTVVMALAIFLVMQPWAFPGTVGFPRSALLIEFVLSVLVLGGMRFASRVRQEDLDPAPAATASGPPRPVLIYGAGEAGAQLVREMLRNRMLRLEPIGFVDDDPAKRGQRIYGLEVLGRGEQLPELIAERQAAEVIVALPRISGADLRRIVTICDAGGVPVRTLPGVQELLDDTVAVNRIRPVRVEDLLRREPQAIPDGPMRQLVHGKVVLVTGAGGSIGSELCRQVASLGCQRVLLLERAETPLFYIDEELRRRFPGVDAAPILSDVTDEAAIERLFAVEQPDVVLHAAAHKHVPLSERHVNEAVIANVRGTRVVAQASARHGVGSFIFISTDKAVDPTSVMGATKRVGEILVRDIGEQADGRYVVVRFGNVMGSQGSVLELFRQQIADGGPVTVTHPEMTRFFMTIPEAVRLILLAGAIGQSGSIYVLNMGQPVRIMDLARDLIRLSIPSGEKDIELVFTGLRPGEKMEETLFGPDEEALPTEYPFLLVARQCNDVGRGLDLATELEALAARGDRDATRARLTDLSRVTSR
jgi:FlaA1/EpsC-like NDP-sugar epimerase/lipopolysaccharide/colanic/teichoic acid biosynthesis glycosyltransferase